MIYRIGTRGSKLALAQTSFVKARLEVAFPTDAFEIVTISTKGDRVTDRSIASIGDTALFTHEIERALADGEIDLAVHSMKDLPADCADGLTLTKAWPREDPRDVLILKDGLSSLDDLPLGATVATGSPRRSLFLRRIRPDLKIVGIRGNVDTRLRKLFDPQPDEPLLDGLVLAAAGLKRIGRESVVSQYLNVDQMIPAPNQGMLAIEVRAADAELKAKLDSLGSDEVEKIAVCERGFLREIGADCHVPVAAHAAVLDGRLTFSCAYATDERARPAFVQVAGDDPEDLVCRAATEVRRQVAGEVVLVGAGPGDPELITLKGLEAIERADVIVYDRLIPKELLSHAKAGCDCVYVGKTCGNHTMPQGEINALLLKKAMSAACVVRLKGGDPFVFGRGGEEMEYLLSRGVACHVVPGVTSAIAAPSSVGIPVTHRGVSRGFEVITAHARDDEPLDIDFTRLLDTERTLVFLMGLRRVAEIAVALCQAGRAATTPAAVVSAGTTDLSRCVVGTLDDIAGKVDRAGLVSPAILLVGDVVRMRERLGFPLSGRRCLVPEVSSGRNSGRNRLPLLLRGLGAEVNVLTVGRIEPVEGALRAEDLRDVTWLAVTSRNGLLPFDADLVAEVKARRIRIAAIGRATATALEEKGLKADFVSADATGEGFRKALEPLLVSSDVVLHPTLEGMDTALSALAAVCDYRPKGVYRNVAVELEEVVNFSNYDAAFFTCASSVRRVCTRAQGDTCLVAIGPTTRAALEALGKRSVAMACKPTPEALVSEYMRQLGDASQNLYREK